MPGKLLVMWVSATYHGSFLNNPLVHPREGVLSLSRRDRLTYNYTS